MSQTKNFVLKEEMKPAPDGVCPTLESKIDEILWDEFANTKNRYVDLKVRLSETDYEGKSLLAEGKYAVVFYAVYENCVKLDFFQKIVDFNKDLPKIGILAKAYKDIIDSLKSIKSDYNDQNKNSPVFSGECHNPELNIDKEIAFFINLEYGRVCSYVAFPSSKKEFYTEYIRVKMH